MAKKKRTRNEQDALEPEDRVIPANDDGAVDLAMQADDYLEAAYGAFRRAQRVRYAREALRRNPQLSDALLFIGQEADLTLLERVMYMRESLRLAEKALPSEALQQKDYPFWYDVDTRPYLRALYAVGRESYYASDPQTAIEVYSQLLELNPNDNQGVRYELVSYLIEANQCDKAQVIVDRFVEEPTAQMAYPRALLEFVRSGDSDKARELLKRALEKNAHVSDYLKGACVVTLPDRYSLGSKEEADIYASHAIPAWKKIPGAMKWLKKIATA
jgi:tetratricopeptide (TPR) repeat protein